MCRACVPLIDADQVLIALVWAACCLAAVFKRVFVPSGVLLQPPRCGGCGYDLTALAEHALCPECGAPPEQRARSRARTVITWQPKFAKRIVPACMCFAIALFLGKYVLASAQAIWLATSTTYSLTACLQLAFHRLDLVVPYGWSVLPLCAAFSPLTVHARSSRKRWLICLLLLGVPWLLATTGELDLPYRWS